MATISLAKALKYQKRVAERISKISQNIASSNSIVEGNERDTDIGAAIKERLRLVNHLVELKVKKNRANSTIQEDIFRLAELKGEITFLNGISTTHGKSSERWSEEEVRYVAHLRKVDIDKNVLALEAEIDRIQDRIDKHNHITMIEIDVINFVSGDNLASTNPR